MRAFLARLALAGLSSACANVPVAAPPADGCTITGNREAAAREALTAFLDATESGRWPQVWRGLASELRARYTPERLERDFLRAPGVDERLRRARLVLAAPARVEGARVLFPISEGTGVALVCEGAAFQVAALE